MEQEKIFENAMFDKVSISKIYTKLIKSIAKEVQ